MWPPSGATMDGRTHSSQLPGTYPPIGNGLGTGAPSPQQYSLHVVGSSLPSVTSMPGVLYVPANEVSVAALRRAPILAPEDLCTPMLRRHARAGEHSAEQAPASLGSAGHSSSLTAFFKKQLGKPHKARAGAEGAATPAVGPPGSGQLMEQAPSLASSLGTDGKSTQDLDSRSTAFRADRRRIPTCAIFAHSAPIEFFINVSIQLTTLEGPQTH